MDGNENMNNCVYNSIYTRFNEDFGTSEFFSYNLQYPSFYNKKNSPFVVNPSILDNINSTINLDVSTFKQGLSEEEQDYNQTAAQNSLPKRKYRAISSYAVTFNKNHILSVILRLMGISGEYTTEYDSLNNYNIDLLTGNTLTLKDIFNPDIDYIQVINNYINYKINQNKELYYENTIVDIPESQSFYITDEGLVIYFGVDEIAPIEFGIPKFKMSFMKFAPYINPRFLCDPQMVDIASRFRHKKSRH